MHYDPKLPLILACNAFPYEIGTVLAHPMSDESEKLIGYAFGTLSKAEKKYSQLHEEGRKNFHLCMALRSSIPYVFGCSFELMTAVA